MGPSVAVVLLAASDILMSFGGGGIRMCPLVVTAGKLYTLPALGPTCMEGLAMGVPGRCHNDELPSGNFG